MLHSDMVTLRVGSGKKDFRVHKDVISSHSEYFQSAFNGDWEEADTRTINLEDADPTAVNVVVAWLHTDRIHYVPEVQCAPATEPQPGSQISIAVPNHPEDTQSWSWDLRIAI